MNPWLLKFGWQVVDYFICHPSRHYFLQEQQEEIMAEHHKMRASEVPPYAQAMVLAGLLEQYDNMASSQPFTFFKIFAGKRDICYLKLEE